MKTSKRMQQVIETLAAKHGLNLEAESAHLRLELSSYMPLVIEKIGRYLVSVAHYYEQNYDLIADPDVVFFTGYGDWVPIEITHPPPFGYHRYAKLSDEGDAITHWNEKGQTGLAAFAGVWARNLEQQGWLEATNLT